MDIPALVDAILAEAGYLRIQYSLATFPLSPGRDLIQRRVVGRLSTRQPAVRRCYRQDS